MEDTCLPFSRPQVARSILLAFVLLYICPGIIIGQDEQKDVYIEQDDGLVSETDEAGSLEFSPDGRLLAGGCRDKKVRLWDVQTGAVVRVLEGAEHIIGPVAYSPDGKFLAAAGHVGPVFIWDAATSKVVRIIAGQRGWVSSVAFTPDGQVLAVASWGWLQETGNESFHVIRLYDFASGKPRQELARGSGCVHQIAFSPDGKTLAHTLDEHATPKPLNEVRLLDVETGKVKQQLSDPIAFPLCVAFSPDGNRLAAGQGRIIETSEGSNMRGHVTVWDLKTGKVLHVLGDRTDQYFRSVAFSPDGRVLASGCTGPLARRDKGTDWTTEMKLWELESGKLVWNTVGGGVDIPAVAFSPDGKGVAVSSSYEGLKLFDSKTGRVRAVLTKWTWSSRERKR